MFPCKVQYIEASFLEKRDGNFPRGVIEGIETSKEIEALLVEEFSKGYELHNITPVQGVVKHSAVTIPVTTGFMVCFKRVH